MNPFSSFFRRKPEPYFTTVKGGKVKLPVTNELSKWKRRLLYSVITGMGLFSLFPLIIDPLLFENDYKKKHEIVQAELRKAGYHQQPGQLRQWEDPFKKRPTD